MKTDEIMELVLDYADERKYGRTGQADAKPVRTAIEALAKDAEKWRATKPIQDVEIKAMAKAAYGTSCVTQDIKFCRMIEKRLGVIGGDAAMTEVKS